MEHTIKNVLAATDFSQTGNNAVMAAINICKQNNAVLHLLHVFDSRLKVSGNDTLKNEIDQEARSQLYNIYEWIIKEHEVMVRIHMPTGAAVEEICKTAAALPVDLIVIGTNGLPGWKKLFIGSTAFKVIKNTAKPVLTIPLGYVSCQFKKILFPVRPTGDVVEKYRIIQPFIKKDSSIHIAMLYMIATEEEVFSYQSEVAETIMSLRNSGIDSSVQMYNCSNPASKTLDLCREYAADLLVINTSLPYNKWTHYCTVNYTRQIINHAAIPVLNFRFPAIQ